MLIAVDKSRLICQVTTPDKCKEFEMLTVPLVEMPMLMILSIRFDASTNLVTEPVEVQQSKLGH